MVGSGSEGLGADGGVEASVVNGGAAVDVARKAMQPAGLLSTVASRRSPLAAV